MKSSLSSDLFCGIKEFFVHRMSFLSHRIRITVRMRLLIQERDRRYERATLVAISERSQVCERKDITGQ